MIMSSFFYFTYIFVSASYIFFNFFFAKSLGHLIIFQILKILSYKLCLCIASAKNKFYIYKLVKLNNKKTRITVLYGFKTCTQGGT